LNDRKYQKEEWPISPQQNELFRVLKPLQGSRSNQFAHLSTFMGQSGETSSPLNGEIIDVHKYSYVNDKNIFINIEACRKGQTIIYAVGKFEFNASTLALLIRQHSQYSESIIQLVFWDRKTRTITEGMDLADSFGDEGWYFDMESWINRDRDSDLEIVTRIKDSNYDSELDKRTVTDSLVRHVWHLTAFIQSNINKNDTTLYPLKRWE
jgi:hypothetical protein